MIWGQIVNQSSICKKFLSFSNSLRPAYCKKKCFELLQHVMTDLQSDRNQASLLFDSLWSHSAVSCSIREWISESGTWNGIMIYTQRSWQTESDGETRSCFLSGNRTSLSLYTEERSPGHGQLYWLSVLGGLGQSGTGCTLFYHDINQRWISHECQIICNKKLIEVGAHSKAHIP